MLLDFRESELTGREAQTTLDTARITTNCNSVPFDKRPPFTTSGLRLGTPAVTTRGMREAEMDVIADFIARSLASLGDDDVQRTIAGEVGELCAQFLNYPEHNYLSDS